MKCSLRRSTSPSAKGSSTTFVSSRPLAKTRGASNASRSYYTCRTQLRCVCMASIPAPPFLTSYFDPWPCPEKEGGGQEGAGGTQGGQGCRGRALAGSFAGQGRGCWSVCSIIIFVPFSWFVLLPSDPAGCWFHGWFCVLCARRRGTISRI